MINEPAKNLQKQDRTTKGTFARGISGNPRGRERRAAATALLAAAPGAILWMDAVF